jgi:hypothetical protein
MEKQGAGYGLDSSGLEQDPLAGIYEVHNTPSGTKKGVLFPD